MIQAQTNAGLIAFTEEEVRFTHETSLLAGTLRLPATSGPHPALVMIQGSGPTDRTNFGYFPAVAEHFARNGIAVLCYDKPGEGNPQAIGGSRRYATAHMKHSRRCISSKTERKYAVNVSVCGASAKAVGSYP